MIISNIDHLEIVNKKELEVTGGTLVALIENQKSGLKGITITNNFAAAGADAFSAGNTTSTITSTLAVAGEGFSSSSSASIADAQSIKIVKFN